MAGKPTGLMSNKNYACDSILLSSCVIQCFGNFYTITGPSMHKGRPQSAGGRPLCTNLSIYAKVPDTPETSRKKSDYYEFKQFIFYAQT